MIKMPKLIKNPFWEEIVQQVIVLVALISAANISIPWMQAGCIIGWGLAVLPFI